jgi:hypothetical protein
MPSQFGGIAVDAPTSGGSRFGGVPLETSAPAKERSWLDSVGDYFQGAWDNLKQSGQGMVNTVAHPIQTVKDIGTAQDSLRLKAEDAFKKGDYATGLRHSLSYLMPVIGPSLDQLGDQAQSGEVAKALGGATSLAGQLAAPQALEGPAAGAMQAGAEHLYRTALKPRSDTPIAKVQGMVRTGLENNIPISPEGVAKLSQSIDDLNQAISGRINTAANAGQTIDRNAVAQRLQPVEQKFAQQVAPEQDLRDINKIGDQFVRTNSSDIPVAEAQAKKIGTYQQVAGKYGKVSDAAIEAQKALARGIKEELVTQMPELANLNAQESKFLDLQGVLEKAVNRASNRGGGGLMPWAAAGTAGAATHSLGAAAVAGFLRSIIADPEVRSRLGIALNKAQGATPHLANAASYSGALAQIDHYVNSLPAAGVPQDERNK